MDYPNAKVNSSAHSHKLLVKLLEAYDLPRKDVVTGSDPLVKLKVAGLHRSRKSTYKSNTSSPVWNQEIVLRAYRAKDVLHVKVYDHDRFSKNDLLGIANIPLAKYMQSEGKVFDEWIPLMKRKNIFGGTKPGKGQVHLQLAYGVAN